MRPPHLHQLEYLLQRSVQSIIPYRKNWCVETAEQKWIAKRTRDPAKLSWWLQVDHELRTRGFTAMPQLLSDGSDWFVMPFVEGSAADYASWDEVEKVVQVLAHFHRSGCGLETPPEHGAAFLLYQRIHDRLVHFYEAIKKAPHLEGELGELLRHHGRDFYLDGIRTWERLERLPIQEMTHRARYHHALTHRDLASHNWLLDISGTPWLIDFETADYDLQSGDVWQIASRILAENDWQEEWIEHIFTTYEAIYPLSPFDKKMITTLFSFPNEFYRETIGLIERKKGYTLDHSLPYLQTLAQNHEHWKAQVKRMSEW